MKYPITTATLVALATVVSAQAKEESTNYKANPVYNAPEIEGKGQTANITGTWSPIGLDPMDFGVVVSLAYDSETTYSLKAEQITGTGTGVGANDSYIYTLYSDNAIAGDVVRLNVDYTGIDKNGPEANIFWDRDPGFKVNRSISSDNTALTAYLTEYEVSEELSVFKQFSAEFTVKQNDVEKSEDGEKIAQFSSDGVIFTSAKAGPVAWSATETTSVPEPSSTLLLGLGSLFLLRRKR